MKKLYSLPWGRYARPWVAVLLLLLSSSVSSFAQAFTETFGTAATKTVGAANTAKDFDNKQLIFSGNSSVLNNDNSEELPIPASSGYAGASGGSLLYFGPLQNGVRDFPQDGVVYTTSIRPIDISNLTNISLSFGVYVDPGGYSQPGDFVAEYRTASFGAGSTYIAIGNVDISRPGWNLVTFNNPFVGSPTSKTIELRFRRLATSGDLIAIDDVRLIGTVASNFTITPTSLGFPNTAINAQSASQTVSVSGSGLTSNINVVAPSGYRIRRQGDAAYLAEGATLALVPTNGAVNSVVEVVFNPTAAGTYSGQITFNTTGVTQKTVSVSGTAVAPTIAVSPSTLAFGNVETNTKSNTQSIAVQGSSLMGDISVQVPTGYEFRKQGDAAYLTAGNTLMLTQASGTVNAVVEVRFAPVVTGAFNGNVSFVSAGATTQFVTLTGTGVAPAPVVTVSPANITFSDTQVGRSSTAISFFVSGQNLDNNTIIVNSPSNEFLIRRGTAGAFGAQVTLTGTGGTLNSTELQVQFSPSTTGNRAATIAASSGTTVNSILQVNGNGLAAPTVADIFINPDPATLDFGPVSSNGSAQVLTFKVGGTLLGTNPLVLTPASSASSNPNIEIREAGIGDFESKPLSFQPVNGRVSERTIEVRLAGPLTTGNYAGTITASSPNSGAPNKIVNVVANSNGTAATISADNTLTDFSTVPGVASATQSYKLNGQGLIRDITVQAPNNFQVALQEADFATLNGATGNTITVTRNNATGDGFQNPVSIYVRYLPSVASAQPDLASISNTSDPAVGAAVQVKGFSAPSVEILAQTPQINNVVIGTVSNLVAVTVRASRVRQAITVAEVLTQPSQFNNPLQDQFQISLTQNDADFGQTVTFTPDANTFSIDQVVYVRYKPTHIGDATSKLQFRSDDFTVKTFQDFSVNGGLSGRALDTEPTVQTTISVTRNGSSATVFFSPTQGGAANGSGEGRLIIASLSNSLSGSSQPQDGQSYLAADGTFGQGNTVAPGYYAVYTGTGDQAVVKGLDPNQQYYFYVFDYNYVAVNNSGQRLSVPGAENYRTPTPPTQIVPVDATVPGTPLPVELKSFAAKLTARGVKLDWATASEKNNKGFEVQRSQDGEQFSVLQFVKGQGSKGSETVYSTLDEQPLSGTSYYRLKQVDEDGTFAYSPIAAITNTEAAREMSFYPNPVRDVLHISANESLVGARVIVTDLTGRTLLTSTLDATNSVSLSTLRTGTYLVTIETKAEKVTRKVVKE
ncbi:T9SS type A sorting domain-containing protein [Hymenobacter sp. BT507]|uniref:T9SS type A sorting domain-containing protein n=1 Tax=Hymenobacter citatus TaxID=2763506 RepID=A0ABR7MJR4_9BACT|nr:T9SS type A sorting domain-containing protein [Hymenobacter citatus]MBC6611301.1 T9SS type A sorting domain-containing protein [Hymenobacter citatus]